LLRRFLVGDWLCHLGLTIPLLQKATQLADFHALRAYDAVQLAAALEVRAIVPSLTLISGDGDLNNAATAEGLLVDDLNTHP
jgi:predicted nucleic acid-binding protein